MQFISLLVNNYVDGNTGNRSVLILFWGMNESTHSESLGALRSNFLVCHVVHAMVDVAANSTFTTEFITISKKHDLRLKCKCSGTQSLPHFKIGASSIVSSFIIIYYKNESHTAKIHKVSFAWCWQEQYKQHIPNLCRALVCSPLVGLNIIITWRWCVLLFVCVCFIGPSSWSFEQIQTFFANVV